MIANGLLFNISWLAIVTSESALWAPLIAAGHVGLHYGVMGKGQRELLLIGGITLFGLLLDQFLFAAGLFTLQGQPGLAPLWLSCLWPVLATTLGHAFAGLQQRPVLASVLGAIGGGASYLAGTSMTAVDFGNPVSGLIAIAAIWALLFPALSITAKHVLQESDHATSLA